MSVELLVQDSQNFHMVCMFPNNVPNNPKTLKSRLT